MLPIISLLALAVSGRVALAAPAIPLPMLNIPELVSAAAHAEPVSHATVTGTEIEFEQCDSVGKVSKVTIEPCQGGNGTLESPCEFHYGS